MPDEALGWLPLGFVEDNRFELLCTQVTAPVRHECADDVKKLFQASLPEGEEGSKMEEIVHAIINNEVDINKPDDKGDLVLHEAIKVCDWDNINLCDHQ